MADNCITCDVAIVGSGFAGSLIANELSKKGIKVVILEAGPGVQPNINDLHEELLQGQRQGAGKSLSPRHVDDERTPG